MNSSTPSSCLKSLGLRSQGLWCVLTLIGYRTFQLRTSQPWTIIRVWGWIVHGWKAWGWEVRGWSFGLEYPVTIFFHMSTVDKIIPDSIALVSSLRIFAMKLVVFDPLITIPALRSSKTPFKLGFANSCQWFKVIEPSKGLIILNLSGIFFQPAEFELVISPEPLDKTLSLDSEKLSLIKKFFQINN